MTISSSTPTSVSSVSPAEAAVSVSVQNANDLHAAVNAAVQSAVAARPKNTNKGYTARQTKWKTFCTERAFDDGLLVTEAKVLLWLQASIVPTGNTKKKAREAGTDREDAPARLCYRTVDGYVSAALDLYKQQQSLGTNSHPHPRGKALKSYLESMLREETKRKRDEYEDRQAGTIQDGYSHEVFARINQHYLSQITLKSNASRNRLDHLLSHGILARGETMRTAQLADLFALPLPNEGAQECHAVVLIMNQGKTNQFGRLEYGGCMRYKNVVECPQAALALYLFERFHLSGEPFPSFQRRNDWYDIHLLKHKNPKQELTYRAQYDNMSKVLQALNITSSKKTHLNRGGGARRAEENGASEAQIRRAGRWVVEKMQGCYLTGLPRESMRAMAGFSTAPGSFHLARACIDPPAHLQQQIFPAVDEILDKIENGGAEAFERDLAAQGFLRLLRYLRRVLLQDAAALRRSHPHLPLFAHPLFQSDGFKAFEKQLHPSLDRPEKPVSVAVTEALPEMAQFLNTMQNNQLEQGQLARRTDERIAGLAHLTHAAWSSMSQQLETLSRKKVRVDVFVHHEPEAEVSSARPPPPAAISYSATSSSRPASAFAFSSAPPPPASSQLQPPSPPAPPPSSAAIGTEMLLISGLNAQAADDDEEESGQRQQVAAGAGHEAGGQNPNAEDPIFFLSVTNGTTAAPAQPEYKLSREITSITDLWAEWEVGLNGQPPVNELEERYGAKWRAGATERKFFGNRKIIWNAIKARAEAQQISPGEAAEELERARCALNKSIDWCQKNVESFLKSCLSSSSSVSVCS